QNGSGKTTSIAKIANYLQKNKISVVLAASDTFRAASIHQLKEWGGRLKVKVIAHDYGSDPAAVAFDGIKFCQAHKIDVLLVDTAGRQHSNINLMKEMEKIVRIAKPDLKIFIGEAIVGNDAVQQAEDFNKAIGIDGSILTKADVDEKGGAIVSISYITKKPILFLGVGQMPSDLKEFSKEETIQSLGF
ncbi:MAG: signal recognition particle-docking protein FtsY, partial [Nanoarchaeota archaeon]